MATATVRKSARRSKPKQLPELSGELYLVVEAYPDGTVYIDSVGNQDSGDLMPGSAQSLADQPTSMGAGKVSLVQIDLSKSKLVALSTKRFKKGGAA